MSKATGIAIFFLLWWVTLFAVLPWGVRSQQEGGEIVPGTDPGAPMIPRLGRKLVWTTLVAAVLWGVSYFAYTDHLVTISGLLAPFGLRFSQ
jgi:predicted secreted protein